MIRTTLTVTGLALACIALAGCDSAQKAAEYAIARDLPDPASARFRAMRINHEGVVCGEVDGKNKVGGYTGYRQFMYYSHTGHGLLGPENVSDAAIGTAQAQCRAAAGTPRMKSACAEVDRLTDAQRKLDDFRSRYVTDCE